MLGCVGAAGVVATGAGVAGMRGMTASWACEEPGPVPGSGRLAGVLLKLVTRPGCPAFGEAGVATCLGFDPPAMIISPVPYRRRRRARPG